MGPNMPEWFLSSVGAIFAGGLVCGIYNTTSPENVTYIAKHAPLNILVLEDNELLQQILNGKTLHDAFPSVKKVVFMNDASSKDGISWQDLIALGQQQPDQLLVDAEAQQVVNGPCMLVYTSGTTGPPKGAKYFLSLTLLRDIHPQFNGFF